MGEFLNCGLYVFLSSSPTQTIIIDVFHSNRFITTLHQMRNKKKKTQGKIFTKILSE